MFADFLDHFSNQIDHQVRLFDVDAMPAFFGDHVPALGERFCQIFVGLLPDRKSFLK